MTYICYQGNDKDCGFASLKMLLANKSKNKSYLYIDKPSKKKNYTFFDLVHIAGRYGFLLTSYLIPKEDVIEIPKESIVLLNNNHAVYFVKASKRRVTYIDPGIGKVIISNKEFERRFSGYVLECSNAKDAKDIKLREERMKPIWIDVVHYLVIGVVFASLLTGFYMIKDDTSIYLTVLFLLIFAIGELVENWYIIKQLKLFDKRYLSNFFSRKSNQNLEKYRFYNDYKKNYFIVSKLLVSSLIMISAFSTLLCINDYRNVFVFLILLLVKVLDNTLFSKREKDDIDTISGIESIVFDNEKTMLHSLERANNLAHKVALTVSIKRVVYIFLSFCLALGMMLVSQVMSTNFLIFHFGIYFMMSESFGNVISFFSDSVERKKQKARFLDHIDL